MNFNLQSMNPSLMATRDQALSVFNHPFSQSHYFLVSNLKNGSFLSPINTHTLFTTPKRFQPIIGCLGERNTPAKTLRQILESPGAHQGLACFDGLSAKLVERAGFQYSPVDFPFLPLAWDYRTTDLFLMEKWWIRGNKLLRLYRFLSSEMATMDKEMR
ncbi:hypothetical protein J1N35_044272 [Gossypium stocksii]|uniref:Uncharacterized protein n=1 Tax=Gossypium stocksii TaxID=47602 RepID=A0A9D3U8U2_9ROSI|nr:hypothetical protein J1N35_044272 [Gossypium stocksii]